MMALMSDEDFAEVNAMCETIRHYRELFGYTKKAVEGAIKEIREGEYPEGIAEHMNARAEELRHHLNAIEETLS